MPMLAYQDTSPFFLSESPQELYLSCPGPTGAVGLVLLTSAKPGLNSNKRATDIQGEEPQPQ